MGDKNYKTFWDNFFLKQAIKNNFKKKIKEIVFKEFCFLRNFVFKRQAALKNRQPGYIYFLTILAYKL